MATKPDWNGETYHRVSQPQFEWGKKVLESLALRGDETVLDVGCGSGRLTALLAERLPHGKVIGVDASQAMLDVAARELSRFGLRVSLLRAEAQALSLPSRADVIFSTATFHWVADHGALFASLARNLKPSGRVHAQWGGEGNLHRFLGLVGDVTRTARWSEYFDGFEPGWYFKTLDETRANLMDAGFEVKELSLSAAPTPFVSADDFRAFVSSVVLRHHLLAIPEDAREAFLDEVVQRAGAGGEPWTLDYVRLNCRAVSGAF